MQRFLDVFYLLRVNFQLAYPSLALIQIVAWVATYGAGAVTLQHQKTRWLNPWFHLVGADLFQQFSIACTDLFAVQSSDDPSGCTTIALSA
jgi:hypothetical protein